MKKIRMFCVSTITAATLSACNSGTTAPSNNESVSTMTCKYGYKTPLSTSLSSITSGNTADMANILTGCEFNRIYRGGNDLNLYPTMYSENPGQSKGGDKAFNYTYYSYDNLVQAYSHLFNQYPQNAPFNSGDYMADMRELSAFLANIGQETNSNSAPTFDSSFNLTQAGSLGNGYALFAVTEGSCAKDGCLAYGTKKDYCTIAFVQNCSGDDSPWSAAGKPFCKLSKDYCATGYSNDTANPNNQYFGRGGKQLSYSYNYMYYGSKIYPNDRFKIGDNPSLLDTDGVLGWETALAYWAIPYEDIWSTKPSMHQGFFNPTTTPGVPSEFNDSIGFGKTINIINGGVECGANLPYVKIQTLNRINSYIELLFLTYGLTPIDRVEVTRSVGGSSVVDTYTKSQLLHNISTQGVHIRGYDYAVTPSTSAPHLVKYYTRNGVEQSTDYSSIQPGWNYIPSNGKYGRYNSQPLIQEYYAQTHPDDMTDVTKVMLYYDLNSSYNTEKLAEERLDCSGVKNFAGK